MKASSVLKILVVIAMLFIGNRIFNHVNAWGGIALMVLGCLLAVYFIIKPSNNHKEDNEKD